MDRTTKAVVKNSKVVPNVGIHVDHVGPNDYRLVFIGIGEHSQHEQFGLAFTKAQWLGQLEQDDMDWEIAKVHEANDKKETV